MQQHDEKRAEKQEAPPSLTSAIINFDNDNVPVGDFDNGTKSGNIEVVFRDIEARVVREVKKADAVLGCVAWLTNEPILSALSEKWQVSIIVQKEDFLRPDSGKWKMESQRKLYSHLPKFNRAGNSYTTNFSFATCPWDDAIRCAGYSFAQRSFLPRMHNKFLVLCRCSVPPHPDDLGPNPYRPYAVITGSFNMTHNATQSLENVVIINDENIADAYGREYGTIFGISEPLDWNAPYIEPEYRIGT